MGQIRPESEVDRTQAALAAHDLALPLEIADVEVQVADRVCATRAGQRLVALLVNLLARMKGVTGTVHVVTTSNPSVLPGVPLLQGESGHLHEALGLLVSSLNSAGSEFRASIAFGRAAAPVVRISIGTAPGGADIIVACDAWRVLFGTSASAADWEAMNPIGSALAAVMTAAEGFKRILMANGGPALPRAPSNFVYSAFNYGVGDAAEPGPDVSRLDLDNVAITGCGAGGSGVAVILAMHPAIAGRLSLIEPGRHKVSNLNRYLASSAVDVHLQQHKLASLVGHLARAAPSLALEVHARPWEQLDAHPWGIVVSAVDTIEARWQIQQRSRDDAVIVDLAVDDLLYSVLRVAPGSRCLFCKHPYDPDLGLKQRALRWGTDLTTVEKWTATNRPVDKEMLRSLAHTQNRRPEEFAGLLGVPFRQTPALLECGSTALRADVPSQAPVLPLATTAVAVAGTAEIIKQLAGLPILDNWLAHDLRRNPAGPWAKRRGPAVGCPHHGP